MRLGNELVTGSLPWWPRPPLQRTAGREPGSQPRRIPGETFEAGDRCEQLRNAPGNPETAGVEKRGGKGRHDPCQTAGRVQGTLFGCVPCLTPYRGLGADTGGADYRRGRRVTLAGEAWRRKANKSAISFISSWFNSPEGIDERREGVICWTSSFASLVS